MLVHLAIDENEVGFEIAHSLDEAVQSQRLSRIDTAAPQIQEAVQPAGGGIRLQKLVVATRTQLQEPEAVMLDELAGGDGTGVSHPMTASSQATSQLDTRVEETTQSSGDDEDATLD